MITRTLEMSVPAEGTINGRSIGIYATNEHDGYVLMMFEAGEQIAEWAIGPESEPVAVAQLILHDDATRKLIKQGILKEGGKPQ